jgi:radical SAM/Cys-rich protein
MPISRFLEYLIQSGNLKPYMRRLNQQFNAQAANNVMCRSMISVGWDGRIYDCDFNQMLEIDVQPAMHIAAFSGEKLCNRRIALGQHCYGCTAGAGSSCGGTVT